MPPADGRRLAAGSCALLAVLLAGCNDTRDLAPPDPSTPWRPSVRIDGGPERAAIGEQAAGAPSVRAPADDRGFGLPADPGLPFPDPHPAIDPSHAYSLVELVDLAERNNRQTRIAWEQARQAAIGVGISRAALLPSLTLSALGGFRHETTPAQNPQGYIASDTVAAFPTLTMTYLLTDFGATDAAVRAARDTAEAADVGFTLVHQQLILSVARAYLQLAAASANLEAARSALRNADVLYDAAHTGLRLGEGTVTGEQSARSDVAQARYAIAAAEAAQSGARDALLEVLGLPPRSPLHVEALDRHPVPPRMQGRLDALMRDALRSRPDLLAALARLRASEADTARARAALFPTLSLNVSAGGDIGRISIEGGNAHSFDQPEAGIYLNFHWAIYQGGLGANQVRLAESRQAQQVATLQQAEEDALREVAVDYDELDAGLTQYEAAVEQQGAARTAFESSATAFRDGVGTITAAETTEKVLDAADATLARTHAQVLASAASLAFATGQLTSAGSLPGDRPPGTDPLPQTP